jgi:hypothetical protein
MVTFDLTDQVRSTIQQTLYQLLANRRNMFLGSGLRHLTPSPGCWARPTPDSCQARPLHV